MSLAELRPLLGWCLLLNFAILALWFAAFVLLHDTMYRLHGKLFAISRETFDAIHYAGMAAFKIGIILLNIAPYLAISLAG